MRQLVVIRHAEANLGLGQPDIARDLSDLGHVTAAAAGRQLSLSATSADLVLASTAVRVQETLDGIHENWTTHADVETDADLYLASLSELGDKIKALPESIEKILIVGHNPGLSELVTYLTGLPVQLRNSEIVHMQAKVSHWAFSFSRCLWNVTDSWSPLADGSLNVCR